MKETKEVLECAWRSVIRSTSRPGQEQLSDVHGSALVSVVVTPLMTITTTITITVTIIMWGKMNAELNTAWMEMMKMMTQIL